MTITILYRYNDNDTTIITPHAPPNGTTYTTTYRLTAGEGMMLTRDGMDDAVGCVDTDVIDGWIEVAASGDALDDGAILSMLEDLL